MAPDRRARAAARHDRNRIACAVASCLLAYGVARMLVGGIAAGSAGSDRVHLGQMIALFCLPVMVVMGFGAWRQHAGLLLVGACGCLAAGLRLFVT
ncbi:hypothetical protein LV564_07830 [Komagataeibacter nataicola]|uniref:hypothetical protein n=1 Tax=Komagataeibacter nataicola TaxID=265960 RepID=UPI0023DD148D|nr:hypothetical protein [Komagataeibacter nataicola]WEQ56956.1 hypothetical protein LV564_07830 [Komagataeibacter nataicola]